MPLLDSSTLVLLVYLIVIVVIIVAYFAEKWGTLSHEELEDYSDIMQNFYHDPDFDDFMRVYKDRKRLIKHNGKPIKFWLWGVYLSHPDYFDESRKETISEFTREIERGLRNVARNPSGELLDCIWMLYFASGDKKYAEIVKKVANECPDIVVSGAASWSYQSIIGENPFDREEEAEQPVGPAAPAPPPVQPAAPDGTGRAMGVNGAA